MTSIFGSLVEQEWRSRLPITHSLDEYVSALQTTAPPIVNTATLSTVATILVVIALSAVMYISIKYPRGGTNSRGLLWVSIGFLAFTALMVADVIDESVNNYSIRSFGDPTNGFLADGIGQAIYTIAIPACVVIAVILITINFVKKMKSSTPQKSRTVRATKNAR